MTKQIFIDILGYIKSNNRYFRVNAIKTKVIDMSGELIDKLGATIDTKVKLIDIMG